MHPWPVLSVVMLCMLNVTDVSTMQRTIISLDKKDTGLETSKNFSVFM